MKHHPTSVHDADLRLRVIASDGVGRLSPSLLWALSENALAEDRGAQDIAASVEVMRSNGLLKNALPKSLGGRGLGAGGDTAVGSVRLLMQIAQVNLSAARLYEGHVNAVQLVDQLARDGLRHAMADRVADGALLGLWRAEGTTPVQLSDDEDSLSGQICRAVGLGVVSHAVVTLDAGPDVRLCLADTSDPARQGATGWSMQGLRACAAGRFDFDGFGRDGFTLFGAPGDYLGEPGCVTGLWRSAALQLGGTFGLLEAARKRLSEADRLDTEAQLVRLARVLQRAVGAIGLVERAAEVADGPAGLDDPERAVALSIFALRETDSIGQAAIAAVERAVGLDHFDDLSETGRIARDLATCMRQVDHDALQQRAARAALLGSKPLLDLWRG